ncbi:hypothetical protein CHARACLAT_033148 [Characodon lateralis]|uniref:Uncharacterized protein n=1 Tax=Characodon lateralis TaxID=208331 RepID=A0ABU7CVA8_9TELE|nr:hypothetical protein [Characodon lateralis]
MELNRVFTTHWSKTFALPDAPPDSNVPETESSHPAYRTPVLHRPINCVHHIHKYHRSHVNTPCCGVTYH